jgi:hydroxymethylglutaryl-CoA reductase
MGPFMQFHKNQHHFFEHFSKLNRDERLARLLEAGALTQEDIYFLQTSVDPTLTDLADRLVENVIGCFPLPLGVATNFHIDGNDYFIPMAVEETSIIAAASKTAKWVRSSGSIKTTIKGQCIIGQVQIPIVQDIETLRTLLQTHKNSLINELNQGIAHRLFQRGGGVQDLILREIPQPNTLPMAVIHVLLNPCDAMGANIVSQICEALKPRIEGLTNEQVGLCILSNLADTKLTQVNLTIHNIDLELGRRIEAASLFASADPYRATTHNKGVLNGIDAVLIATGNDWRAVEAGVHAYAARHGQYQPITRWHMEDRDLHGFFEAPVVVGTVGGVTRVHPTAQLCLKLLGVKTAEALSRIVAAVGLVQNLGALRALSQEGICQGHMKLHIDNLLLAAGATHQQMPAARHTLEKILQREKKISLVDAERALNQ